MPTEKPFKIGDMKPLDTKTIPTGEALPNFNVERIEGDAGFGAFETFIDQLKTDHPKRVYEDPKGFDPNNPEYPNYQKKMVTYVVKEQGKFVGMMVAVLEHDHLKGQLLITDPNYESRGVATRILETAQKDFDAMNIVAWPLGYDKGKSYDELVDLQRQRTKALFAFYARRGFSFTEPGDIDTKVEQAIKAWDGADMVWKKKVETKL
jgi:ribosomal protein S18 acetylase RimI-like enzyme